MNAVVVWVTVAMKHKLLVRDPQIYVALGRLNVFAKDSRIVSARSDK
jgi:hypothetical protein